MIDRLRGRFGAFFIRLSLMIGSPWLTAMALAFVVRPIGGEGKDLVLCVERSIFVDDVKAIAEYGGAFCYVGIFKANLDILLTHFFGDRRKELKEYEYHNPDFCTGQKKKLYEYWLQVLPILCEKKNIVAILSGNFVYLQQQEMARAAGSLGIPFLVLHKEGVAVPEQYDEYAKVYNGSTFIGAKLLFYNDRMRNALLAADVAGLGEQNSTVVGIPRFDKYFQDYSQVAKKSGRAKIVFFSFYASDKVFYLLDKDEDKKRFQEISDDFHLAVIHFASKRSDVDVTIKTKRGSKYLGYVTLMAKKEFETIPSNLTITNFGNAPDMILGASAVLAFNSTTQIEAVAAGKIVIGPKYDGLPESISYGYFMEHKNLLHFATTAEDIEAIIDGDIENNEAHLRESFLSIFMPVPAGAASKTTELEIKKSIKKGKTE